ncbi:MAG TPA: TonB-dependent receptor [Anaeromyxobacter sp.]|nr:TonB-dependent receptor [Anaeromyxobacter sp.]
MATSSRRPDRLAWCGLVLALLFAGAARAQTMGAISGAVADARTGKPVVGATVQAEGPGIEGNRTVLSEAGGVFTVADLPAGTYTLSVAMPGYEPYRRADLVVKEDTTLRANVRLAAAGGEVEEVVVTGSRIRRKDLTTPAPVTVIERKEIEESGVVGLGEFLQHLPVQGNAANAQKAYGNDGQVRVDLRSLESKRTLVLVNGRRMVAGGSGGDSPVDLNTIPLAAVERIEILKDGASPIYGSDAVAGVVNVILRKKFEGTQVSALSGVSSRGDARSYDLSASTGISGERGSAFFSIGYQEQRPLLGRDRGFSREPLAYDFSDGTVYRTGSGRIPNGIVEVMDPARVCADPASIGNALLRRICQDWVDSAPDDPAWRWAGYTHDPGAPGGFRPLGVDDVYNFQTESSLLTPARRLQLFATGNYELHPHVRAFYEASFVNAQSSKSAPPAPVDSFLVSGQSVHNPFGADLAVTRRFVELGPRRYEQENDAFRVAGGLEGDLGSWAGPLDGWSWDLSYVFGRNVSRDTVDGALRLSALNQMVGPSYGDAGVPRCGTPGAPIAGCVPLDVLHGPTALTPEQRSALAFRGVSHGFNELHVLSLAANGRLFTLWADRPAGLAVGADWRRESGGYTPDSQEQLGDSSEGHFGATRGGFSTREAYAELVLPLLSGRPLVDDLELLAAVRGVRYSSFGTHTSYKLGGRWRPIRDVTLRGTFSTAFRAPSVLELYEGNSDSWESESDPCSDPSDDIRQQCEDEPGPLPGAYGRGQVRAIVGGNPDLQPETARILTAGVVLEPRWVKDLSFTVDYWAIDIDDTIGRLGTGNILTRCYSGDGSGAAYCGLVHRDPATGQISYVDDVLVNLGGTVTSGIDLAGRWIAQAGPLGRFQLSLDATYLLRFDQTYADGSRAEAAGTYDLDFILPRWRGVAGVSWQRGGLGISTAARYIGSFEECYAGSCTLYPEYARTVPASVVFDVAAGWQVRSGLGTTALQLGVRNLFDRAPPFVYNGADNNTDPAYDYVGRYWWGRVTQVF